MQVRRTEICIFLEEQFDLTVEFCENIEDYRNTTDYDDVENVVRKKSF